MLDCELCTLTHSLGWAAEPLGLALAPGLATMRASSDAETAAEPPDTDGDGEVGDGDGDGDVDAAGDGEAALLLVELLLGLEVGLLVELCVAAGVVGESAGEAEVPDGDGDGDGVGDFDGFGVPDGLGAGVFVAEGVGDGVAEAGIAWHVGLAEVPAVRVSVTSLGAAAFSVTARAVPDKLASMPAISKAATSKPSAVTRTGAKRMRIALSTLLIRSSGALMGS